MHTVVTIVPFHEAGLSVEENLAVVSRIEKIIHEWEGTRYQAGCQTKGVAVDCVRFVSGVLDELYGEGKVDLPRLPQDISFHDREGSMAGLKHFLTHYPHVEADLNQLQPGDVIVAGPRDGGPGHGLICGETSMWHCDSRSVDMAGLCLNPVGAYFIKKAYRPLNRSKWLCL